MKVRVMSRFGMNTLTNENGQSIASVTSKLKANELAYRWNEHDVMKSELTALRSQVAELQEQRQRDALDGQAALDEANNRIVELQRQLDGLPALIEQAKEEVRAEYSNVVPRSSMNAVDAEMLELQEKLHKYYEGAQTLIEQAKAEEADRIGKLIHWPECWDTAAYPTLEDALTEINHCTVCENPEAHGYPKDWKQQREAIRARKP